MKPGSSLELQWVNLWKSPLMYRNDKSVWSNSWKQFMFIDDRKVDYTTLNVINDHTSRVPQKTLLNSVRLDMPKVLHYQFSNWPRMLSKQAYYRISEFIQRNSNLVGRIWINFVHYPTKDEHDISLSDVPREWIATYLENGIDLKHFQTQDLNWYDVSIINFFGKFGEKHFSMLDIWDIDWESQRKAILAFETGNNLKYPERKIRDPRNILEKFYHRHIQILLRNGGLLHKIYRFIKAFFKKI